MVYLDNNATTKIDNIVLEENENVILLNGNATEDKTLKKLNIDKSLGVIVTTGSDVDNLFIVLTTRELYNDAWIVSRASKKESINRLKHAGANKVISPESSGGTDIYFAAVQPNLVHITERHGVDFIGNELEILRKYDCHLENIEYHFHGIKTPVSRTIGVMDVYACTIGCTNYGEITGETYASYTYGTGGIVGLIEADDVGNDSKSYVIACRNLTDKVTLTGDRNSGGIVGYQDRQLSGVYGSYTVKSDVANAFTACVPYNPNSATNDRNKVFESATDDDLTSTGTGAGVMNLGIENAFTAMDTAPKSPYVSSGNYNTYKDYRWTFLALDSWPVFQ